MAAQQEFGGNVKAPREKKIQVVKFSSQYEPQGGEGNS